MVDDLSLCGAAVAKAPGVGEDAAAFPYRAFETNSFPTLGRGIADRNDRILGPDAGRTPDAERGTGGTGHGLLHRVGLVILDNADTKVGVVADGLVGYGIPVECSLLTKAQGVCGRCLQGHGGCFVPGGPSVDRELEHRRQDGISRLVGGSAVDASAIGIKQPVGERHGWMPGSREQVGGREKVGPLGHAGTVNGHVGGIVGQRHGFGKLTGQVRGGCVGVFVDSVLAGAPAADGQVQVAIAVGVAPGHARGSVRFGRCPQQVELRGRAWLAAHVGIDLIWLTVVTDRQVQVTIVVPVSPGQACRILGSRGAPCFGGAKGAALVLVDQVRLPIVADSQIGIAVAVIVGPGHTARVRYVGGHPCQAKRVIAVVAVNLVWLAIISHGEIEVPVAIEITPRDAAAVVAGSGRPEWRGL